MKLAKKYYLCKENCHKMLSRLLIIFIIQLLFYGKELSAQEEKKVVVTEIKYVLVKNTSHQINSTTFPFYFNDDVFFGTISNSLINTLKVKFNVAKVTLMPGTTIEYGTGKPFRKIRPKIPENSNENDIYVGLASYLSYDNFDSENDCYKLVTLVSASDFKGKILYKSENKIPFKVRSGDWIQSDTVMNWRDFEYFYIQGIEAGIKGDPKKYDTQTIDHQSAGEYDQFTFNSIKYKLIATQNNYFLQKPDLEKIKVLNFSETSESDLSPSGSVEGIYKFQLENLFEKKNYTLTLYGSKEYTDESNFTLNVIVDLSEENDKAGVFKLDYDLNLTGNSGKNQVYVFWNWNRSVAEFIIDNQLVALLHEENKQRTLYYSADAGETKIGQLCNLLLIYHLANIVMKETEKDIMIQNSINNYPEN
jgi:hypothetical protein